MPAGGLITAGVIGAGTLIYGAIQKSKAEKAAAKNVMPTYTVPQSENDNLSLAESMAGQGMTDSARTQLQNNANQGLSTSTNAILRSGGSANNVASAEDRYQQGINQNSIYDDQARLSNLSRLQSAYTRMSADADKSYQINEYAPWANRAQAIAQQLQSGQQTLQSGLGTTAAAITSLGTPMYGAIQKSIADKAAAKANHGLSLSAADTDIQQRQVPSWNAFYPT